ncbi:retrotransposon gag domain-containing protein, partial [Staphylococcus aureus]|nr:retrotransposon gag domain-containing protein [Staphylococcus aureus]
MNVWKRDKYNRLVRLESPINTTIEPLEFVETLEEMDEQLIQEKTLIEYFSPAIASTPSCIVLPQTSATHFELKPAILQLLPSFYGLERDDPYMHVKEFLEICSTFRFQNFNDESVRLRMFPFSLKDKAKAWLNSLPTGTITSWNQLVNKFLSKFFPISKTDALRREISIFYQKEGEQFHECWERFNNLLLKYPYHGFEKWRLVKYFYDGLTPLNCQMIQSMHGGKFLLSNEGQAWESLESLSENSQHWNNLESRDRKSKTLKKGGIYEVSDDIDVKCTLANLTRKVEALALSQNLNHPANIRNEVSALCVSTSHTAQTCPSILAYQEAFSEQTNALYSYGKSS